MKRAGSLLDSIISGLDGVDLETRQEIMESYGEACAHSDGDFAISNKIVEEEVDAKEILDRANKQILWCDPWACRGATI